ncbi:MAG TPA: hypothetical protein VGI32_10510 [Steroidobacteraceae bacterium]|jgi:uncharacterized membrane protein SpoIIM required for sporulation
MNAITSKLTAGAAALLINGLVLGAVGYLFELQSQPHLSVVSAVLRLATHQWLS